MQSFFTYVLHRSLMPQDVLIGKEFNDATEWKKKRTSSNVINWYMYM